MMDIYLKDFFLGNRWIRLTGGRRFLNTSYILLIILDRMAAAMYSVLTQIIIFGYQAPDASFSE
jgi:hypothetical protein